MNLELLKFHQRLMQLFFDEATGVEDLMILTSTLSEISLDDLEKNYALLESEYCEQIDASILASVGIGPLLPLSPIAQEWRRKRVLVAATVLLRAASNESPFSEELPRFGMTEHEIFQWLTVERWYRQGRRELAKASKDFP